MFDRRAHFIIPCRTHSPAIYDLPTIEERQKTHVAPKAVFAGCEHPRRPLPRKGTLTPDLAPSACLSRLSTSQAPASPSTDAHTPTRHRDVYSALRSNANSAMIPPTPSATVPPDSSAQLLLRLGQPFIEFPRFSILELQRLRDQTGNALPFSEWLTKRLHIGQPFVIQDFDKLEAWDRQFFEIEKLIELSTKKSASSLHVKCASHLRSPLLTPSSHRHSHPELQLRQRS